ncbi:MAG: hypothetical protein JWL72_3045 [Ilumatobacteraceae bacterium]|nr:hypothetical protein [Ilumatobacteraceae bacterium]
MSRRIEIELTSARPDGTWTWRAAGAREPKGVLATAILPSNSKVGDILRAEVEVELDGTTVLNVAPIKGKAEKSGLLEILPSATPFEAVTQQLARGGRSDRGERGDRGDRRDRPPRRPDGDRPRSDGDRRPPRADGDRTVAPTGDRRPRRDGDRPARGPADAANRDRRPRPNFTPPPELPQRPKPKRLKPGRAHRIAVLADLPEEQRAVAERALQGGIPAVRQAVQEQNTRLKAEGKEEIPAAGLIQMAEQLLPKLRVAEWLDRAEAAKADIAELALPDLRSVVASSEDPVVARDETTRALALELKQALVSKQESETLLWLDDITAALGVGRVIRALKLSSQPPKAGVPFPQELAISLAEAATASLTADAMPDRWAAILEAAAFAPVRAQIKPTAAPTQSSDELASTIKRLAPALPHIAALFGIEVAAGTQMPKPMRPTRPGAPVRKAAPAKADATPKPPKPEPKKPAAPTTDTASPAEPTPDVETPVVEAETPTIENETAPVVETPAIETAPEVETPVVEAETAPDVTPEADAAPVVEAETQVLEAENAPETAPEAGTAPVVDDAGSVEDTAAAPAE